MHAHTHTHTHTVCLCVCVCVCACVLCPALHLLQMLLQKLTIVLFFMWAWSLLQTSNKKMTGIVLILVMFVT